MKTRVTLLALTALAALPTAGLGTENDQLTREERDRVGHLYAQVIRDEKVREAREAHAEATRHYHDVLRQAMIERDSKVAPALAKIRINPALLAEAIWEKRNKEVLNNLHLPISRLDSPERDQWHRAMDALHEKEITKAFSKRLERNYQEQAKLRKEQVNLMNDFKKEARRNLLEIDPALKGVFEKLDHRAPAPQAPKEHENPEGKPAAPDLDAEADILPPMPMPMPMPSEEC